MTSCALLGLLLLVGLDQPALSWAYLHGVGMGHATKPINGLGQATNPINGLGQATNPINGLGQATNPINGLGQATNPINGLGQATNPINGLGQATNPINGLGQATKPINGLGQATKPINTLPLPTTGNVGAIPHIPNHHRLPVVPAVPSTNILPATDAIPALPNTDPNPDVIVDQITSITPENSVEQNPSNGFRFATFKTEFKQLTSNGGEFFQNTTLVHIANIIVKKLQEAQRAVNPILEKKIEKPSEENAFTTYYYAKGLVALSRAMKEFQAEFNHLRAVDNNDEQADSRFKAYAAFRALRDTVQEIRQDFGDSDENVEGDPLFILKQVDGLIIKAIQQIIHQQPIDSNTPIPYWVEDLSTFWT